MAEEKEIGKITHYFDRIGVGIVELTDDLKVGETIHIKGNTTDFTQTVGSIEIEHQAIEEAKKGDVVGLKVEERVREGDKVYKILE